MDYVVGSVAALISGNVTPNRPKKLKKAATPMKHQPSPNVTPKSEFVEDRSIFLSPTMQKKKAIIKKSPKRIFQNPDMDVTNGDENDSILTSPKADKVKKHLKDELDAKSTVDQIMLSPKSPNNEQEKQLQSTSSKKKLKIGDEENSADINEIQSKKKKKNRKSADVEKSLPVDENVTEKENLTTNIDTAQNLRPKKKTKKSKTVIETKVQNEPDTTNVSEEIQKKKKNNKSKPPKEAPVQDNAEPSTELQSPKKKNKKRKNKQKTNKDNIEPESINVNSNAVTNKDTDSEHESDDEIESENEEINKKALETEPAEDSSDDEAEKDAKKVPTKKETPVTTEDEIKRTIFVGNVPFSNKCKKEVKKIFTEYGQIETVRIRTVPVKDATVTPKMAVIKKDLHPDRNTVNVYVKFTDPSAVNRALAANNTVLRDHHLRVSRSDTTGAEHDPKCSVFVGNIPFALEDEALRAKFVKCGEIESVRIIRDKKTNAGKGFGYVNFASKDGVELALALTEEHLTIKNRILRVKRCTQTTQRKTVKPGKTLQGKHSGQQFGRGKFPNQQKDDKTDGAYRRVMNKRKNQDSNDGPPNKRQNLNQPHREKKARKEFVGMTAEKKKKPKFNKGQKKKKVLSEILTKK